MTSSDLVQPRTRFSWAQRRRDDPKDLDEFRRLEQLVGGSGGAPPKHTGRLHIDQVRQRPNKQKEASRSGLVHRFYETAPARSLRAGPDECTGLVPGLESRRELNAVAKAELAKLHGQVASLTAELEAARAKTVQLESQAVAAADCATLAKQNAKLRERNRELAYQVKQGLDKANSTADELQQERIAFSNEKAKFLKEMKRQKGELDRQSQLLLQAQLPDRNVRERVEQAEGALASFQEKSQFTISKLKAELSRQKVEIDQLKEANAQLKSDLQAVESRRLQQWNRDVEGEQQKASTTAKPEKLGDLQTSIRKHLARQDCTGPDTVVHADGRVVSVHEDGTVVTKFANNAMKTVKPNGHIQMKFANGDERFIYPDREEYRYESDGILHITLSDGVQKFEFPGGQKETHYPDGSKKIIYSDGVVKYMKPNGDFDVHYPIGLVRQVVNGGEAGLLYKEGAKRTNADENIRPNVGILDAR